MNFAAAKRGGEKVLCGKQKKSSEKKKSEKQRKHKKLLYVQSVCFCVRVCSTWKMSLSLARALTLLSFLLPRQTKRIVRPLVLGTLFRASSFRTRGARSNERKRCIASV